MACTAVCPSKALAMIARRAAIVAEIERLHAATYPGDAALVRAAVLDARLRKDLS